MRSVLEEVEDAVRNAGLLDKNMPRAFRDVGWGRLASDGAGFVGKGVYRCQSGSLSPAPTPGRKRALTTK